MKQQVLTTMIKDVRVLLEENVNASPLEGVTDVGSISINEVIKGVIPKAVTAIAKIAPMELFMQPSYKRFEVIGQSDGIFQPYSEIHAPSTEATAEIPFISNIPLESLFIELNGITGTATKSAGDTKSTGKITISFATLYNDMISDPSAILEENGTIDVYMGSPQDGAHLLFTINVSRSSSYQGVEYIDNGYDAPAWKFSSYNGGYFKKPVDYLRTLYVQGSNWQRPVTELTPLSSPYVFIARSEINLSVGNPEKPLVVDSFVGGSGVLEAYPMDLYTSADLVYVETPIITKDSNDKEQINCDDGIYTAAVFYAAYLVANIKAYQNAESYKTAALDAINSNANQTNATAGAEVGG